MVTRFLPSTSNSKNKSKNKGNKRKFSSGEDETERNGDDDGDHSDASSLIFLFDHKRDKPEKQLQECKRRGVRMAHTQWLFNCISSMRIIPFPDLATTSVTRSAATKNKKLKSKDAAATNNNKKIKSRADGKGAPKSRKNAMGNRHVNSMAMIGAAKTNAAQQPRDYGSSSPEINLKMDTGIFSQATESMSERIKKRSRR